MTDESSFSKRDVERIVREIAGPIAREVAAETAKAVAGEITGKLTADITKAMSDVSKVMTDTMAESFRILGMDKSSEAGIARAHRRNEFVDRSIAERGDFEKRMVYLDALKETMTLDDARFLRTHRQRHEDTGKSIRENIIRAIVPLIIGAILASAMFWLVEARHSSKGVPTPEKAATAIMQQREADPEQEPVSTTGK